MVDGIAALAFFKCDLHEDERNERRENYADHHILAAPGRREHYSVVGHQQHQNAALLQIGGTVCQVHEHGDEEHEHRGTTT